MRGSGYLCAKWGTGFEGEATSGASPSAHRDFGPLQERYVIHRHLRDGGSASVYAAYDQQLMRSVAVKRYVAGEVGDEQVARYWREARLTGWLAHPNIVPVYDVLPRDDGGCDLVMKLVDGETFSDRIARSMSNAHDPDVLEQHLRDLLKVCDAIDFAHSRGVVHRDIKPTNIMVGAHGEVYVMDWGIAKVVPGERSSSAPPPVGSGPSGAFGQLADGASDAAPDYSMAVPTSTLRGSVVGTPAYMAPEQAGSDTDGIDHRTDIFGLGAVLYEILTGVPPYRGDTFAQVVRAARERQLIPPDERTPSRIVSPELRRVCMKAMAQEKDQRYQRVGDFASELLDILRGGGWFEIQQFQPGQVIVREGEPSESAFVLKTGHCRVVRRDGDHEQELHLLGPGDVFGEVGLVTGQVRSATIIAKDAVQVQVISSQGMKESLARQGLVGKFLKALAGRFRDVDQDLFEARRAADSKMRSSDRP
jgi:serine/threonine-protein kinase